MKNVGVIIITLCVVFLLVGIFIGKNSDNKPRAIENVATVSNNESNLSYIVNRDEILFIDNKPKSESRYAGSLKFADYPKLQEKLTAFNSNDNPNYLEVKTVKLSNGKNIAVILNSYPSHGDFGSNYAMVYSLDDKKVLYETDGLFDQGRLKTISISENGDITLDFIYGYLDLCNSCGIQLKEFISYDQDKDQYITVNTTYKSEFEKLLQVVNERNKCYVNWQEAKELTFSGIKNQYGEDFECQFANSETYKDKLTPKMYFKIKQTLEDIVNGQEKSVIGL